MFLWIGGPRGAWRLSLGKDSVNHAIDPDPVDLRERANQRPQVIRFLLGDINENKETLKGSVDFDHDLELLLVCKGGMVIPLMSLKR